MGALKAKKPLLARTPIKKESGNVKKRKYRRLEQKTAQQMWKDVDKLWSRYIRLRDSSYVNGEWWGECITCSKRLLVRRKDGSWTKGAENGHYITRGYWSLTFNEFNCNLQCSHCNAWLDKDEMITRYRKALAVKYGDDTRKELKALSLKDGAKKRPPKNELLQIMEDCKEYIDHCLANPENYAIDI